MTKRIVESYVNGFKIYSCENKRFFVDYILSQRKILLALNAEKIYHRNAELLRISQKGIAYPDGVGAIKALRRKGVEGPVRIPGSELWLDLVAALNKKDSVYLIGSTDEVLEDTVDKLKLSYPELNIVGKRNGYLSEQDIVKVEKDIIIKKPTIVFVAQGSPRQERLMERLQSSHQAIYMGLGGSFDVFTENVKRAPRIFRENGLEWLFRLLAQPKRFKRQWVYIPFLINLYRDKY